MLGVGGTGFIACTWAHAIKGLHVMHCPLLTFTPLGNGGTAVVEVCKESMEECSLDSEPKKGAKLA